MGDTKCQILKLKYTEFYFRCGCVLDPLRKLTAPQTPVAVFKEPTSKGKREKRRVEGEVGLVPSNWGRGSGSGSGEDEGRDWAGGSRHFFVPL